MKQNSLERINQTLRATKRINRATQHIRQDARKLLQEVCNILAEECGYDAVWIGELRNGEPYPALSAAQTAVDPYQLETHIAQAPYNLTVAKQAFVEDQTVVGQKAESRLHRQSPRMWMTAATPIRVNDTTRAILTASTTAPGAFDAAETQLLEEIAADVSFALESMEAESRRAEAEEALRTSEERFRRLSEHALIGILLIQGDLIRYSNPAAAQMFGYENPVEMIDRLGPLDLTAAEHQAAVEGHIAACLNNEMQAVRFKFKGRRKDGSLFDVETYGAHALHARRPAIIASIMDITARELSRRQLEALSEAGLALSQTRTPHEALQKAVEKTLSIVFGDAANIFLVEDQRIKMVAATGYERLNIDLHTVLTTEAHPEKLATYTYMAARRRPLLIVDTGSSALWQHGDQLPSIRSYLGTPLIVRDELIGFLNVDGCRPGQFTDADAKNLLLFADYVAATIEHLRLIESLETERQRLTILNGLSQTLAETLELREVARRALAHIKNALNIQHGHIHLWDKDDQTLTAISEEGDVQPVRMGPDLNAENAEPILTQWVASQRIESNEFACYLPLKVHDEVIGILSLFSAESLFESEAEQQLLKTLSVPIALALQNARFYEATAHQAKVLEEALRRQEELDRMKDEMLQNISHELRTPIALVKGYGEMLRNGSFGPIAEEQADAIEIVARRSAMLHSLVENSTLVWKIENLQGEAPITEPIDLGQIVQNASVEFQNEAHRKKLTLHTEIPENAVVVIGNLLQLYRLIDNLIDNALKFTSAGGQICIRVEQQGDEAVLSVCDNGIGVPKDKLAHIFERFYQLDGSTKRRYGGVGLGLALVKTVVTAHGGTIYADSPHTDDPERPGLCVVVRLPLRGIRQASRP